jgi:hypothetical protein
MPDEKRGQNPTGNSDSQPPPTTQSAEPSPPPMQEGMMRKNRSSDSNQNQDSPSELAKEVHWIQHATFWSQIGLGMIGILALYIYYQQLTQMRFSTDAAKSAADTAREALVSGARALVSFTGNSVGMKRVNNGKINAIEIALPWTNSGNTPTRRAFSVVDFDITSPTGMDDTFDFRDRIPNIPPRQFFISPKGEADGTEAIPIQEFHAVQAHEQRLYVWGWITYHDIFPGTPTRLTEFCDEIVNVQSSTADMTNPAANLKWNMVLCPLPHNCSDEECLDYEERTQGK